MGNRGELILVAALLLGQLIFLAAQIQDPDNQDTLLDRAAIGLTTPVASGIDGAVRAGEGVLLGLRDRASLKRENEALHAQIELLQKRTAEHQDALVELSRLQESLGYQPPLEQEVRVARVVFANHRALLRRLVVRLLDEGDTEFAKRSPGSAVVTEDGLVGRVITWLPPNARVQLVTDRSSSVGVMVARTRRQGLLRGAGDALLLDYLPMQADVREGDRIVTAGIDGVYPRGVTVGTVISVRAGPELFHEVVVAPAVDFGRLDQVFLLGNEAPPQELMDGELEITQGPGSTASTTDREGGAGQ